MDVGGPASPRAAKITNSSITVRPQRSRPIHLAVFDLQNRSNIIFVTVCTRDRHPFLANPGMHARLKTFWGRANYWMVGRYVIMPDHIHLFCSPAVQPSEPLRTWMPYWKRQVSQSRSSGVWQKNYWDTQLRQHESYSAKWEYVRHNPVRAGLVRHPDDWPYQGELNVLRWHE